MHHGGLEVGVLEFVYSSEAMRMRPYVYVRKGALQRLQDGAGDAAALQTLFRLFGDQRLELRDEMAAAGTARRNGCGWSREAK